MSVLAGELQPHATNCGRSTGYRDNERIIPQLLRWNVTIYVLSNAAVVADIQGIKQAPVIKHFAFRPNQSHCASVFDMTGDLK